MDKVSRVIHGPVEWSSVSAQGDQSFSTLPFLWHHILPFVQYTCTVGGLNTVDTWPFTLLEWRILLLSAFVFGIFLIPQHFSLFLDFKEHVKHVEKGVNSKEPHFVLRVLRSLPSTRKKLNHPLLRKLITGYFVQGIVACSYLSVILWTRVVYQLIANDVRSTELDISHIRQ